MFTSTFVVFSTLLVDTASAHKEKGNNWDAAAASVLETKIREMFKAFDTGSVDGVLGWLDTTSITWDVGADGKALSGNTPEETREMLEGYAKWIKEDGVTVKTTIHKINCHSTSDFGFCVTEFDQAFAQAGAPMANQMFRATMIARTVDGEWRWSHWHASMR